MNSTLSLLAVERGAEFSPNLRTDDALILRAVCDKVRALIDCRAEMVGESSLSALRGSSFSACLSMARSAEALSWLSEAEKGGCVVVNSPGALSRLNRISIDAALRGSGIPLPESEALKVGDMPGLEFPYWIKRADACSQNAGDVAYVDCHAALEGVWADFRSRGICSALATRHVEGDIVKFYGVAGTGFFRTYYPTEGGATGKFGLERINGLPHHYSFDSSALQAAGERASSTLGVPVYGGDCIVRPDGSFALIDFNDWPSFSRCREEAARAIAGFFISKLKEKHIG